MERRTKLLFGSVFVVVLLAVLATTTMGSSAEFVTPEDLEGDSQYEGEVVQLEGIVVDLDDEDGIEFDVTDGNYTVAVAYDGEKPETLSEGREAVAEGHFNGDAVTAEDLTIRAHEGEDGHPGDDEDGPAYDDDYDYDGDEYDYDEDYGDETNNESA